MFKIWVSAAGQCDPNGNGLGKYVQSKRMLVHLHWMYNCWPVPCTVFGKIHMYTLVLNRGLTVYTCTSMPCALYTDNK